jgi:alpha-glucosidase
VTRPVTRYGRDDSSFSFGAKRQGTPTDLALGRRRARSAALLAAALPGSLYIYQGDELGLEEVADLPPERLQDPMHFRSGGADPGRDGCRVPLPWSGSRPPFGFGPSSTSDPWLPQPSSWAALTAERKESDPDSMLSLYREALRLRRSEPGLRGGGFRWLEAQAGVIAFVRSGDFAVMTNVSSGAVALPHGAQVLLASDDVQDGQLPQDATAWLRLERPQGEIAPVAGEERK